MKNLLVSIEIRYFDDGTIEVTGPLHDKSWVLSCLATAAKAVQENNTIPETSVKNQNAPTSGEMH